MQRPLHKLLQRRAPAAASGRQVVGAAPAPAAASARLRPGDVAPDARALLFCGAQPAAGNNAPNNRRGKQERAAGKAQVALQPQARVACPIYSLLCLLHPLCLPSLLWSHLYFCSSRSSSSMRPCTHKPAGGRRSQKQPGVAGQTTAHREEMAHSPHRCSSLCPNPKSAMPRRDGSNRAHQLLARLRKLHLQPHRLGLLRLKSRTRLLRSLPGKGKRTRKLRKEGGGKG